MANRFFWYELMTSDVSAAAKFYGDVVGWSTQDSGQPDYKLFTVGGQSVAGLMPIPKELGSSGRPVWTGYIEVADVDVALMKLKGLGGTVHREPFDVPGVIRFAVVADPQGAVFLVAKGLLEDPPARPAEGTPGTIGWRELYAGEWEATFGFYESMFGWTKSTAVDMGDMGTYQVFAIDGADAGGMMTKPPFVPRAHWGYYFNVADIDAAAARVTSGGGNVKMGPHEVPGGQWIVQAADPQGVYFNLVAPSRASA